jgi:hypothetical protein
VVSRLCEEFACLPSALDGEDLSQLLTILDLRNYARAKQALDSATDESQAPTGPAVDDVFAVELELLRRRNRAREVSE